MAMGDVSQLYARLERRVMQEAELVRYGYPRPGHAPGWARVNTHTDTRWKVVPGPGRRSCERCDKLYEVDGEGWPAVRETCTWHLRRPLRGVHPCCGRREGVGHCQNSPYHVHRNIDPDNLTGFVSTGGGVGGGGVGGGGGGGGGEAASVVSLDCEMVATTRGFEVVAVSVVDHRCRVLYEALLRPEGHVLNYNTPFSGLTEADLRDVTTTLRDAHERLLALLGPRTILVGHATAAAARPRGGHVPAVPTPPRLARQEQLGLPQGATPAQAERGRPQVPRGRRGHHDAGPPQVWPPRQAIVPRRPRPRPRQLWPRRPGCRAQACGRAGRVGCSQCPGQGVVWAAWRTLPPTTPRDEGAWARRGPVLHC